MSYPLSESFASAPGAGYYTTVGSIASVTHNAGEQALDVVANRGQAVVRFTQPGSLDFWFEADLELIENYWNSDPGSPERGENHLGLWIMSGNGWEGWRAYHYRESWGLDFWNSGGGQTNVGSVPDGIRPWTTGERHTLRCQYKADPNVGRNQLVQFLVDGELLMQTTYQAAPGTHTMMPGVFVWGCKARIHSIAGDLLTGLPAFPEVVGAYSPDLGHKGSSQSPIGLAPGEAYPWKFKSLRTGAYLNYWAGPGSIIGTVKKAANPDNLPMSRRVQLFDTVSSLLVAETWSDEAGNYRFDGISLTVPWMVIAFDYAQSYRAVVADNLRAEIPT